MAFKIDNTLKKIMGKKRLKIDFHSKNDIIGGSAEERQRVYDVLAKNPRLAFRVRKTMRYIVIPEKKQISTEADWNDYYRRTRLFREMGERKNTEEHPSTARQHWKSRYEYKFPGEERLTRDLWHESEHAVQATKLGKYKPMSPDTFDNPNVEQEYTTEKRKYGSGRAIWNKIDDDYFNALRKEHPEDVKAIELAKKAKERYSWEEPKDVFKKFDFHTKAATSYSDPILQIKSRFNVDEVKPEDVKKARTYLKQYGEDIQGVRDTVYRDYEITPIEWEASDREKQKTGKSFKTDKDKKQLQDVGLWPFVQEERKEMYEAYKEQPTLRESPDVWIPSKVKKERKQEEYIFYPEKQEPKVVDLGILDEPVEVEYK